MNGPISAEAFVGNSFGMYRGGIISKFPEEAEFDKLKEESEKTFGSGPSDQSLV